MKKHLRKFLHHYLGWFGAVVLVAMYLLNSFDMISAESLLYQFANLFGAVCLVFYSLILKAHANVFVNVVWSIGAIVAICLILCK